MTELKPKVVPGWEGILDPGETIVWQGRPDGAVRLSGGVFPSIFGLFFLGFAIFWTVMAFVMTGSGGGPGLLQYLFPLFGLPFIAVGAYMVFGRFYWDAYVRRQTWYTLTSERAFIARVVMGRKSLKSWPITRNTVLDFQEPDNSGLGAIHFAEEVTRHNRTTSRTRIGFEYIAEPRQVYDLMRGVQRRMLH